MAHHDDLELNNSLPFDAEAKKKALEKQKELKDDREKREHFENEKAEIVHLRETKTELTRLQSLVERGFIKPETLARALEGEKLTPEEIEAVFDKIDEIEQVEQIDKILPKESRPTKEEFLEALQSEPKRIQLITKLNSALKLVTSSSGRGFTGNFFGSFMLFLSKSLVTVQEGLIDIKRALIKQDELEKSAYKTI